MGEGDLLAILRRYELDVDAIWNALLAAIDRLPHDLRGRPGLSPRVGQWLEAAWMRASLSTAAVGAQGGAEIRSAHLLAALVEAPHWLRAPDAWPLLSVSAAQNRAADAGAGPGIERGAEAARAPSASHRRPNRGGPPRQPGAGPLHHRHHRQGACRADRSGLWP